MNILLDTNVLLIWLGDADRITSLMAETIGSPKNVIYFSPLSVWECRIKVARGMLQVDDDLLDVIHTKRFLELKFTSSHADETKNLPGIHRDPFDRGLIAQARVEGMSILTTDRLFSRYEVNALIA